MALQIWLPLMGTLENKGICNSVVTNDGATADANGKLGNCYSFDGSNDYISCTHDFFSLDLEEWSYCCWLKINNLSQSGCLFCCRTIITDSSFNIYYRAGGKITIQDGVYKAYTPSTVTFNTDTWYHIAFVYKKNVGKYIYINGVLDTSDVANTPTNIDPTIIYIGKTHNNANWLSGKLNDVRIYDHALSPKEIKEISKGLVCHYPLNDFVGNENLFKFDETVISSGTGHTLTKDGNTIHLTATNKGYSGFIGNKMDFIAGTTYIVSCYVKAISKDSARNPRITIRASDNGIQKSASLALSKDEDFLSFTYTPTETITNGYVSGLITGATAAAAEAIYSNIKCEIGSKVTPYIPASTDSIYTSMGYGGDTVYDTSGYCNNGTLSSNKPVVDCNSPRYGSCMSFNGTDNYIACGRGGMVKDQLTINLWAYMDDWNNISADKVFISCTQSGGWSIFTKESNKNLYFYVGYGNNSNTYMTPSVPISDYLSSGWHMITAVCKRNINYLEIFANLYVDGQEVAAEAMVFDSNISDTVPPLYYNATNGIFIGAEALGNQTTPASDPVYFNGKISDVRIYATALSNNDIMELYKAPISIDNNGNTYALEYSEV